MISLSGPLLFRPVYQERVWGGRALETTFGRALPGVGQPIGESWEMVDRADQQSIVADGPLAGLRMQELWRDYREAVFGSGSLACPGERFPLLVKILDARDRLSLQVHPPAEVAAELGGEPKTELWYIAEAAPGAQLFVGLSQGVTRESFEQGIARGSAEKLVHAINVSRGNFIFIPSGRLHAIGAGIVIYEFQQNSDTTYRVYDWNRVGLDGKPRQLHLSESLRCIDFSDIEPALGQAQGELLQQCEHFRVEKWRIAASEARSFPSGGFAIVAVISGPVICGHRVLRPGDFCLIPASEAVSLPLEASGKAAEVLVVTPPLAS